MEDGKAVIKVCAYTKMDNILINSRLFYRVDINNLFCYIVVTNQVFLV